MKKKLVAMMMVTTLSVSVLAGCGSKTNEPSEGGTTTTKESTGGEETTADATEQPAKTADDTVKIGCVMMNLSNVFYVNAMEAGDAAAEDWNAECIWKGADSKLEEQVALIENFIQQGVDAIFVDPMDAEGIIPVLEKAHEAGITCVSFGNFVDADFCYCIVYDDYNNMYKMGEICGKYIGEEGTVANFFGSPGNYVSDNREAGFKDGITENYANINLLPSQPANWDAALGNSQLTALLAANELDALFCMNDNVTYGLIEAIEASGQDTVVFSNDGDIEACELVKEGTIKADCLTGAKRAGYYGIKTITQIVRGEIDSQKNYLPSHFVMNEDMKKFCEDNGLSDGMSIMTPDEAIYCYDNYREEFGPQS